MIQIRAAGQDVSELIADPPRIDDSIESLCRKFEFSLFTHKIPEGADVEFMVHNRREFIGKIYRRRFVSDRIMTYVAYDPLYKLKSTDDWHFPGMTLNQIYTTILNRCEIKAGNIPNTNVILPELWYQNEKGITAFVDAMARTRAKTETRWLPRYNPRSNGADLVKLFVPEHMWSFQVGVNLTESSYEEDSESLATVVKVVNRETGKVVYKQSTQQRQKYGVIQEMETVNDETVNIEGRATQLLKNLAGVKTTMDVSAISDGEMPILFAGDMSYIEEQHSGFLGGYHIRNVTHEFQSSGLVHVGVGVQKLPYIPDVQVEDANRDPSADDDPAANVPYTADSGRQYNPTARIDGQAYSTFIGTAYDPALGGINADGNPNVTATGTRWAYKRTIAVHPDIIPYGSVVHIRVPTHPSASGLYLAEDTGGAIRRENKGKRVDILIEGDRPTAAFGRREVEVTFIERGKGPADAREKAKNWDEILRVTMPKFAPKMVQPKPLPASGLSTRREKVVAEAKKWVNKLTYEWGGKNIPKGSGDCSGFTYYVYDKAVGLKIGHGSINQAARGIKINPSEARPGDLVVFNGTIEERAKYLPSHVGIVTRKGYCISLASSGCKEHRYDAGWWKPYFLQVNRVL